jgi:hypothetical protein
VPKRHRIVVQYSALRLIGQLFYAHEFPEFLYRQGYSPAIAQVFLNAIAKEGGL